MSIVVLGAGRMGSVIVKDLQASGVDKIIVADVDIAKAEKVVKQLGGRCRAKKVDLANIGSVTSCIRNADAVANAGWYEFNLVVTQAAIDVQVPYVDLGGLYHMTRKQLRLHRKALQNGCTIVVGGGESPGLTNVLAKLGASKLDSTETIMIRVGSRDFYDSKTHFPSFPFAVGTVLDELSMNPIILVNGKFREVLPLSGEEKVEFPKPVGINTCHYSLHSELATLPNTIKGVRDVDFKLGVSLEFLRTIKPLIDLGLLGREPIRIKGTSVSPKDFLVAHFSSVAQRDEPSRHVAVRVVVHGEKNHAPVQRIYETLAGPKSEWGLKNGTAFLTGIVASVVVQMLAKKQIVKRGVLAPEQCVEPNALIAGLKTRGVEVKERVAVSEKSSYESPVNRE